MDKKDDILDKEGDSFYEQKEGIKQILANKRKRLQDKVKQENIQEIAKINEKIKKLQEKMENLKEKTENLKGKISMIEEGEERQLAKIEKEIKEEENDIISALDEDIKIKRIFATVKAKIQKDK